MSRAQNIIRKKRATGGGERKRVRNKQAHTLKWPEQIAVVHDTNTYKWPLFIYSQASSTRVSPVIALMCPLQEGRKEQDVCVRKEGKQQNKSKRRQKKEQAFLDVSSSTNNQHQPPNFQKPPSHFANTACFLRSYLFGCSRMFWGTMAPRRRAEGKYVI